jgi:hypothetical protein
MGRKILRPTQGREPGTFKGLRENYNIGYPGVMRLPVILAETTSILYFNFHVYTSSRFGLGCPGPFMHFPGVRTGSSFPECEPFKRSTGKGSPGTSHTGRKDLFAGV